MCKINLNKISIALVAMLLLLGYTGCAPATSATRQIVSTEAPAAIEVPGQTQPSIQIRYSAMQMTGSSTILQDLIANVAKSPDLVQKNLNVIPTEFLQAVGCPGTMGILPSPDVNLFMMSSHTMLFSYRDGAKLQAVPQNLLDDKTIQPFQFQINAFRNPNSKDVVGLPIGTMPVMLIFNPDKIKNMPDTVTLDDVISIANENTLVLPIHMGIGGATFQALGGDNFSEETSLDVDVISNFLRFAPQFNQLQKSLRSASDDDLVAGFAKGTIAWTIHDSSFLLRLANKGYKGNLDIRAFPMIKVAGSSTMSWAWTVPEGSTNPDVSWTMVRLLANDKNQVRWLLSQGMLPATSGGFAQLRDDVKIAEGFLPAGLLKAPNLFDRLQKIVGASRPWRIPPQISDANYQNIVVPTVLNLLEGYISGSTTFDKTINMYLETLPKLK